MHRGLGGRQSRSGHRGEEKNLLLLAGIEPRFLGRQTRSHYIDWAIRNLHNQEEMYSIDVILNWIMSLFLCSWDGTWNSAWRPIIKARAARGVKIAVLFWFRGLFYDSSQYRLAVYSRPRGVQQGRTTCRRVLHITRDNSISVANGFHLNDLSVLVGQLDQ